METIMNEITNEQYQKIVNDFLPVAESMVVEGKKEKEIITAFQSQLRIKMSNYYAKLKKARSLSFILKSLTFEGKVSKAELIFDTMMQESGISFLSQYKIGPYRADFLVNKFLVVELDGPQHDKKRDRSRDQYMQRMGYEVYRVPLPVLFNNPQDIIKKVKTMIGSVGKKI